MQRYELKMIKTIFCMIFFKKKKKKKKIYYINCCFSDK